MGEVITAGKIDHIDIMRILALPLKVSEGMQETEQLAEYFGFGKASTHYIEIAEALGLIRTKNDRYHLTKLGKEYIKLRTPERNELVCRLLFELPLISKILVELIVIPVHALSKNEIAGIVRAHPRLVGAVIARNAQAVFAWFEWVQKTVGAVKVEGNQVLLPGF